MVAELLALENSEKLAELFRPRPLPDGTEPEQRFIVCGLSWEQYLVLDQALGHDRPNPRCYFLDDEIEIMTTSVEHERVKTWICDLLADYFRTTRIRVSPRGHATMHETLKSAGAEPDASWCIGEEKLVPHLVLEVALTSGGLPKLEIYGRLRIPEVWFWRKQKLEVHALNENGAYEKIDRSRLLPKLDISLLERCVVIRDWLEAMDVFHSRLTKN